MGGSGGSSYFPRASSDLKKLIQQSKQDADRKILDSDINKLLRKILASYERDPQKVQKHLERIGDVLKDQADMETLLFGGSVAKHTYVDGLSDVDALVILRQEELAGKSPQAVLNSFHKSLQDRLTSDLIDSVEKGRMAVTVNFRDGMQIQLLPATRVGSKVKISTATLKSWKEINPKAFQRMLTRANQRLNNLLVPTIKLVKSIIGGFPKQKRLTGYHVESLAVEAVKGYRGEKTVKSLLLHVLKDASKRILQPISDVTGQSRVVDSYLGKKDSTKRRIAADAVASVSRKLNAATSVDQWIATLGD